MPWIHPNGSSSGSQKQCEYLQIKTSSSSPGLIIAPWFLLFVVLSSFLSLYSSPSRDPSEWTLVVLYREPFAWAAQLSSWSGAWPSRTNCDIKYARHVVVLWKRGAPSFCLRLQCLEKLFRCIHVLQPRTCGLWLHCSYSSAVSLLGECVLQLCTSRETFFWQFFINRSISMDENKEPILKSSDRI